MPKLTSVLVFVMLLSGIRVMGQDCSIRPVAVVLSEVQQKGPEDRRANLFVDLALAYMYKEGASSHDLDSARLLIGQAEHINVTLRDKFVAARVEYAYSCILREDKKPEEGRPHIQRAITYFLPLQARARLELGEAYVAAARYYRYDDPAECQQEKECFIKAVEQFKAGGFTERVAYASKNIGDLEEVQQHDPASRVYRQQALDIYTSLHIKAVERLRLLLKICPISTIPPRQKGTPDTAFSSDERLDAALNWHTIMATLGEISPRAELDEARHTILNGLVDQGQVLWLDQRLAMAEPVYLKAIEFSKTCPFPFISAYTDLCAWHLNQGNLNTSLSYALASVKVADRYGDFPTKEEAYLSAGKVYAELGQIEESLEYVYKAIALVEGRGAHIRSNTVALAVKVLIALKRPTEALDLVKKNWNNSASFYFKKVMTKTYGDCFYGMGRYDSAVKYYLETYNDVQVPDVVLKGSAILGLSKIYMKQGQYDKALSYLDEIIHSTNRASIPIATLQAAWYILFEVDSARGQYVASIQDLHQFISIKDSLFNEKKDRQIEEMQVQYKTAKKEEDIQLLSKRDQLQQADLKASRLFRNALLGGAVMLILLLGVLYNRYRLKQRSNKLLVVQQEKISSANQRLQELNKVQKGLLAEKEWLIKEVHHRVKNNLQIVISLLNMQSNYLKDELALNAFGDISARIRAISLIHQKLYQDKDMAVIHMPTYVRELVGYLEDSYAGLRSIRIQVRVDAIELDVAQSVPVGLILNEAITNAIKYAFTDRKEGVISVSFLQATGPGADPDDIELTIADNGRGLPDGFDPASQDSMGFALIQTLCEQLQATVDLKNCPGFSLSIRFARVGQMSILSHEVE